MHPRMITITLDDARIVRRAPEVERERKVAIEDLLHTNMLRLLDGAVEPPYDLFLSVREGRLTFRFTGANGELRNIAVPLTPFRGVVKDYFLLCENYYDAIHYAPPDKLQTIDMARRGLHNEGSELLQTLLKESLIMDFETARRLFTLLCVLHLK